MTDQPRSDALGIGDRRDGRVLVVLVTGLSGAGRSSTLNVLEDEGFEAVDNLPLALLPMLFATQRGDPDAGDASHAATIRIAVGVDLRTRCFDRQSLFDHLAALRLRADLDLRVVYLDCYDAVLIRRFTETRRRHPLATDRPVADGIRI